jgi:DNA-binding MarR family transcriptional regulator/GNAT superfamily N-acetyltransferase
VTTSPQRISAVRRFNRFYTRRIGVLQGGLLRSPYSLTEVRVMYELAHGDKPTASELGSELGLDAGYLSRILRRFRKEGLLASAGSKDDARRTHLWLTPKGRSTFAPLERATNAEVAAMLAHLPATQQGKVVAAMRSVEALLEAKPARPEFALRTHRPGDMGWVIGAHGALYAQEYGWGIAFEGLVAEIVAVFIRDFDARRECCWIAEIDRNPVGSVFVVKHSARTAKLRLLIVEPGARGLGIGARLVAEALRFARSAGYAEMTLWTQSILVAARRIYQDAGFRLVKAEPHASFGTELIGETWEATL